MDSRINGKTLLKCGFIGLYITFEGMVLQVMKGVLLLRKAPPTIAFIIEVTAFYFITGFLFALGYFILRNSLPGSSRIRKGLLYAQVVFFSVAFSGLIGAIGLDFTGGFDLFTAFKLENYAVTLVDWINFSITGMVLGVIAETKAFVPNERKTRQPGLFTSSIIGFFLFPILNFICYYLLALCVGSGSGVPKEAELWFFIGTFAPLTVAGMTIPIFFRIVKGSFRGSVLVGALKFSLFFYLCYWVINIVFGLPFGFPARAVIYFLIASIIPLPATILISVFLQREKASS